MDAKAIALTVVYNNVPGDGRLTTAWGMACLVEGTAKTVLLDTGGDGDVLLRNMERLGKEPAQVDVVVLSHIHADHTGGLDEFLAANSRVDVFVPACFPESFLREVRDCGARVFEVREPQQIAAGVRTTGEMGTGIQEQALVVETPKGKVLVTGCSHPGVARMAERAAALGGPEEFYLITGGFHLGSDGRGEIQTTIRALRGLGVRKVGPSHCTGDLAMQMFRSAWQDDFVPMGCGAQITISKD